MNGMVVNMLCWSFFDELPQINEPFCVLCLPRADDPVCVFKHEPPAPHSVLKFLQDVFASRESAQIFYRTDMMVMIDICVRQLSDLSDGDKVRSHSKSQTV